MVWQLTPVSATPTVQPPAPPPLETDVDLFERLRAAIAAGQVRLDFDFKRLNSGDSPVLVQADGNIWMLGGIAIVAGTGYFIGWPAGAVALIAAVAVNMTLAKKYVNSRVERRVRSNHLKDVAAWRKLWRFGGVALALAGAAETATCRAPDGNWFDFSRQLPPLAGGTGPGV